MNQFYWKNAIIFGITVSKLILAAPVCIDGQMYGEIINSEFKCNDNYQPRQPQSMDHQSWRSYIKFGDRYTIR